MHSSFKYITAFLSLFLFSCASFNTQVMDRLEPGLQFPIIDDIATPGDMRLACIDNMSAGMPMSLSAGADTITNQVEADDVKIPRSATPFVKTALSRLTYPVQMVNIVDEAQTGSTPLSASADIVLSGSFTHAETVRSERWMLDWLIGNEGEIKTIDISLFLEALSPAATTLAAPQHKRIRVNHTRKGLTSFIISGDNVLNANFYVKERVSTVEAIQFLVSNIVADIFSEILSNNFYVDYSACSLENIINYPGKSIQPNDNSLTINAYRSDADPSVICVNANRLKPNMPEGPYKLETKVLRNGSYAGEAYIKYIKKEDIGIPSCLSRYRYQPLDIVKVVYRDHQNRIIGSTSFKGSIMTIR